MFEIEQMLLGRLYQHIGPYMLNEHAANVLLCTNGTLEPLVLEYRIINYDQTIYSVPTGPLYICVHYL